MTGDGLSGGVMEVNIKQNINGLSCDVVQNYLNEELKNISFNEKSYTYAIIVYPEEVKMKGSAAAFADQGGKILFFEHICILALCINA